jgi:hypothetical protein
VVQRDRWIMVGDTWSSEMSNVVFKVVGRGGSC